MFDYSACQRVLEIASKGKVYAKTIKELRQQVFEDGVVSLAEAEALFRINSSSSKPHSDWAPYFIEA